MFNSKDRRKMDRIIRKVFCLRDKTVGSSGRLIISVIKAIIFLIAAVVISIFVFLLGPIIRKKESEKFVSRVRAYH
jgi:flagellar basal body-associated protein FliL